MLQAGERVRVRHLLAQTCRGDVHDILSAGWGADAVSHTGFTGTSVAFDPTTLRWAVLLTNTVHYGRGRPEVFAARRRFHAALVDAAEFSGSTGC